MGPVQNTTTEDFVAALVALDEEYRQRRETITRDVLHRITTKKQELRAARADIDDRLRALDDEERTIIQQCGGSVATERVGIVRRVKMTTAEQQAVPVEVVRGAHGGEHKPIRALVFEALADGQQLARRELVDAIMSKHPAQKQGSILAAISSMTGCGDIQIKGERMHYKYFVEPKRIN